MYIVVKSYVKHHALFICHDTPREVFIINLYISIDDVYTIKLCIYFNLYCQTFIMIKILVYNVGEFNVGNIYYTPFFRNNQLHNIAKYERKYVINDL
jgi:hypothetical protein